MAESAISVREAKRLLEESRALLRRGGKRLGQEAATAVSEAISGLEAAIREGEGSGLNRAARETELACDRHLSFARKSRLREYAESIGVAFLFALVLRAFVVEAFQIPTASMVPTLLVGDHLFVAKFAYGIRIPFTTHYLVRWGGVERGDIVVFEFPVEEVRTQVNIGMLTARLDVAQHRDGRYPESLEALGESPAGGGMRREEGLDAWGRPFGYTSDGETYALVSAGADGELGTGDDIGDRDSAFRGGVGPCLDRDSVEHAKDYIKRVIGLPGDRISLQDNRLFINGVPTDRGEEVRGMADEGRGPRPTTSIEETLDTGVSYTIQYHGFDRDFDEITVRPGHVFVMGDNRDNSSDGRCWGQVPMENIKGTALFIFFSRGPRSEGVRWERIFDDIE